MLKVKLNSHINKILVYALMLIVVNNSQTIMDHVWNLQLFDVLNYKLSINYFKAIAESLIDIWRRQKGP